ncbi:MAG: ferredoxin domain-containing protein [Thermoplasmata archaeon]
MIEEYVKRLTEYLMVTAQTAPKGRGEDSLVMKVVYGEEKEKLAKAMFAMAEKTGKKRYERDGKNVEQSDAVLLIGVKPHKAMGFDCMACGFGCKGFDEIGTKIGDFEGPNCAFKLLDLGIALGSAVKNASIFGLDTRVMYTVGVVAKSEKMLDATVIIGVPVSATAKSPYFDRKV